MDLVLIEGDRVRRNEVGYDRVALATLLVPEQPATAQAELRQRISCAGS